MIDYHNLGISFIQIFELPLYDKELDVKKDIIQQLNEKNVLNNYIDGLIIAYDTLNKKINNYCDLNSTHDTSSMKINHHYKLLKQIKESIEDIYTYFNSSNSEYDENGDYIIDKNLSSEELEPLFKKIFNTKEKVAFYLSKTYAKMVNDGTIKKGYLPNNWKDL